MHRKVGLAFVVLACLATAAQAATITVGDHQLLPNTAGQTIVITVTGGDATQGVALNAQIADGGPDAADLGGTPAGLGPAFTGGSVTAGTIYAANNTGDQDLNTPNPPGQPLPFRQVFWHQTSTASGSVAANGILAILTVDTTGFTSLSPGDLGLGKWSLILGPNQINGPTNFGSFTPTIIDGSITIVPEPTSVVLGLFAAAGLGAVAIRKRRATA